ncbi:hypothetical protein D0Z06_05760 [Geodermatophilus marinus]|nr:hypothetical protein D0Z06_05760 [Geodermatophilus sp. LHW52908]
MTLVTGRPLGPLLLGQRGSGGRLLDDGLLGDGLLGDRGVRGLVVDTRVVGTPVVGPPGGVVPDRVVHRGDVGGTVLRLGQLGGVAALLDGGGVVLTGEGSGGGGAGERDGDGAGSDGGLRDDARGGDLGDEYGDEHARPLP